MTLEGRCDSDNPAVPGEAAKASGALSAGRGDSHRRSFSLKPIHIISLGAGVQSSAMALRWMEARKLPKPPRSACAYCPYHSDNEWRRLRDSEPEAFEKAIAFERQVQHVYKGDEVTRGTLFLHRSCVPLDQVDFSTDEDHGQQVMFGNECEGMCEV